MAKEAEKKATTKTEEQSKDNIFKRGLGWVKLNWKWLLGIGGTAAGTGILGFLIGKHSGGAASEDVVIQLDDVTSFDDATDAPTEE